jgi:hypothetical protein
MLWIEAQWTTVIALLVFGVCYMLTASIACLAVILSRRAVAKELKAIAPVLTPLCVVLGLLIGFLAARVWTNLDRANQYVGQEAGALRDTILPAMPYRLTSERAFGKRSKSILISLSLKSGRRWQADAQTYRPSRWS